MQRSEDDIEELVHKGKLTQYVKKEEDCKKSKSPRKGKVVVNEVAKADNDEDSGSKPDDNS